MMKVVGEEGTDIKDFTIYLKSEFLDFVYLQQNSFDDVEMATSADRQRYVFDAVCNVLNGDFTFAAKDDARRYFQELQQLFIDWNYAPYGSDQFKKIESDIKVKIAENLENA